MTDVDRLIDDVARDITAHEPPAHLRTRVLARLDERRSPRLVWLLIPIAVSAAAVLVTIAVIKTRPATLPVTTPLASSAANTRATPDRVEILAPAHGSEGYTATAVAEHRDVASQEAAAWREALMPSLPAIAALGIAEIQPDTLAIPQLTMKPLVVAPIDDNNNQR
jgi:hypothetical protein